MHPPNSTLFISILFSSSFKVNNNIGYHRLFILKNVYGGIRNMLVNSWRRSAVPAICEVLSRVNSCGGNVISNNITYAPVVHANHARGVEDVLIKDKQILDDWWKQKQWEMARTQWA